MTKQKTVEGWLCGTKEYLDLLWKAPRPDCHGGFWQWPSKSRDWTREGFSDTYDLRDEAGKPCKLPKAGECFWVELEL